MSKINKTWHLANRMPDYLKKYKGEMPIVDIKKKWHEAHAKACSCR